MSRRTWRWVAAAAVATVLLGAAAVVAAGLDEVDRTVDVSTKQTIRHYRVHDAVTVFVSEPSTSTLDLANAVLLAAVAGVALAAWAVARGIAGEVAARQRRFFLLAFLAAAYLCADEALELNETYGYNLEQLGRLRDLDLVAYGVPAVVFVYAFRDIFLSSRRALLLVAIGLGVFAAAGALDAVVGRLNGLEERMEPVAAAFAVAGFVVLAVHQLRTVLQPRALTREPPREAPAAR